MLLATVFALQAVAVTIPARDPCLDDNHRNICNPAVRSEVLEKLGLVSIEEEAATGAQVYRVRFVDGYGRDMPAIAFVRRPGHDPTVEVSGLDGQQLRGAVSQKDWNRVVVEARFADRDLQPLPKNEELNICLHSWAVTVEMANAVSGRNQQGIVRSATQNACSDNLTVPYGFELAQIAYESLAPCAMIDMNQTRNHVTALSTCMRFSGDRFTAASLYNLYNRGGPRYALDRTDAGIWRAYLGTNGSPRLNWDGQEVQTDRARNNLVAEFIADQIKAKPQMGFHPENYVGLTGRKGEITGHITDGNGSKAHYRQTWIWDPNLSSWMLESWTVGSFSSTD